MTLKVLHISDTFFGGGAESVFRDTILATTQLGYISETYYSSGKKNPFSYIFSLKHYFKIKALLKIKMPDIIHLHNYYHFLSPSILLAIRQHKFKYNCKVIYTAHDYHLVCPNSGMQYFNKNIRKNFEIDGNKFSLFKKYDSRTWLHSYLKLAQHMFNYKFLKLQNVFDIIISPSYFLADVFKRNHIKTRIEIARNPIKLPSQKLNKNINDDLKNSIKIILIGRLSPEKGFYDFIKKINDQLNNNIIITIFGEGEEKERITKIKLKQNIKLHFKGSVPREKLMEEISDHDIFCLPSIWYENAPISIIEAASSNLPILVPNYGGLIEMAKETHNYKTFNYDDDLENIFNEITYGYNSIISPKDFSMEEYMKKLNKIYTE